MNNVRSLADMAVETLAAVKAMDDGLTNEHPGRHQIRSLKRLAEKAIDDALRAATEMAYLAKDVRKEFAPKEKCNED